MRLQKIGFAVLPIVFTCSAGFASTPKKTNATNVKVLELSPQKMSVYRSYVGYLKPFERVVLKSEIEGTVEKINFEEGNAVKKGNVLVHVATKRLELQEKIANSNFNQAASEYETQKLYFVKSSSVIGQLSDNTEIPVVEVTENVNLLIKDVFNQFSIKQLQLQMEINESNYKQTLSDYKKQEKLFEKNISNATEMEKHENLLEVSRLTLELSKLALQKAKIEEQVALDMKLQRFQREKNLREKRTRIHADLNEHISTRRLGMQLRLAETAYEHALSDYRTQKRLFEENLTDANALESFYNVWETSQTNLQLAKLQYEQSKIEDNTRLETYRNTMQTAKLNLMLARLDLEKSIVKAPFGGVIRKRYAQLGEFVQKGQNLLEIMDLSKVLAQVNIPEKEVRYARPGKRVSVKIDAFPNAKFSGRIKTLGLEADLKNRSFPAEIIIDNSRGHLYSGLMARVEMLTEYKGNQIIVPRHAVLDREKGAVVFVEKKGVVQLRYVRIGKMIRDEVQILSGLKFGERLVVVGQNLTVDGETVNVVKVIKQSKER